MKKRLLAALLAALTLTACGSGETAREDDTLHILATTYPVYLFTTAVTEGVEGVEVELLVNSQTSCLHDYTLTVNDMKAIEKADIIVMNGVGLEDFMADALAQSEAAVIDCSQGIELLPATGHHDHSHGEEADHGHFDPHIWLDPVRAARMVENIAAGLTAADEGHGETYAENAGEAALLLEEDGAVMASLGGEADLWLTRGFITFHDGFQYFAEAYGLELLKAVEEEEGSEASAADIKEIVSLVTEHEIPAIFTEENGSDSTANAIARETGVEVGQLSMLMSGDGSGLEGYRAAMRENMRETLYLLSGKQASIP